MRRIVALNKRIPLAERSFPDYTREEEMFNMVSHIVGAVMAVAILVLCIVKSALSHNTWGIVAGAIYGFTMILVFTVSSIYHGLNKNIAKQVMRIIDHCDIYFLIAGTYTPILLSCMRVEYPALSWIIFGIEWGCCILGACLNAIDLEKYKKISFACYIVMGWAIILCTKMVINAMTLNGFMWILLGGLAFSIGAVLYLIGAKKRYYHSVFHVFVNIGCLLQFFGIFWFAL